MKYEDPHGNALPKGVFYDTSRKRYRVRVYRHSEPIWCSYHHDYSSAMRAYDLAQKTKQDRIASEDQVINADNYASALKKAM